MAINENMNLLLTLFHTYLKRTFRSSRNLTKKKCIQGISCQTSEYTEMKLVFPPTWNEECLTCTQPLKQIHFIRLKMNIFSAYYFLYCWCYKVPISILLLCSFCCMKCKFHLSRMKTQPLSLIPSSFALNPVVYTNTESHYKSHIIIMMAF